jgi:hypothetical protein
VACAAPKGPPPAGLETLQAVTAGGCTSFHVEIADDEAEREHGLMNRPSMPRDHGMLFEFPDDSDRSFWMHNTYIPLDIVFVQADGKVLTIARDAPACSEAIIPSGGPVRTVIELAAGTADRRGIHEGDYVTSTVIYPYR